MTPEQKLHNVAAVVRRYTTVQREHNGKHRCRTYAANVDAIAESARQLAEMIEAYLNGEQSPAEPETNLPF